MTIDNPTTHVKSVRLINLSACWKFYENATQIEEWRLLDCYAVWFL
jgi:hypothetical protein